MYKNKIERFDSEKGLGWNGNLDKLESKNIVTTHNPGYNPQGISTA